MEELLVIHYVEGAITTLATNAVALLTRGLFPLKSLFGTCEFYSSCVCSCPAPWSHCHLVVIIVFIINTFAHNLAPNGSVDSCVSKQERTEADYADDQYDDHWDIPLVWEGNYQNCEYCLPHLHRWLCFSTSVRSLQKLFTFIVLN